MTVDRMNNLAKAAIDALHLKREKRFQPKLFATVCAKIAAMVVSAATYQTPG
jgi:hypothetical protein